MASWFGSSTVPVLRYNRVSLPAVGPTPFNPLADISGLVLWLDANDTSTIEVNEDTSGANVNRVMKWFDKANPSAQNHYEKDNNPIYSGLYNVHYMNQLNTVYFEPNCYMLHHDGGVTFDFQARTFFAVVKPLTDLSDASGVQPYIGFYNTSTPTSPGVGYMNTGISYDASGFHYAMCENGVTCGIIFDLSNNPLNQRMIVMFAQTDAIDLSGNAGAYDTAYQPLTNSDPADSYATGQSQYILNDPVYGTAQDIAEILMYDHLLTTSEQQRVMDYLADKWNASGPNPK